MGSATAAGAVTESTRAASGATESAAVETLDPTALAARLDPLREAAGRVDAAGRSRFAETYAGVEIDADHDRLVVYSTSMPAGRRLVSLLGRPGAGQTVHVTVRAAAWSRRDVDAAMTRLRALPAADEVWAVDAPEDGSGVEVQTGHPGAVPVAVPVGGGARVPVHSRRADRPTRAPKVEHAVGTPALARSSTTYSPASWAAVKWHDRTPFIGGDVLTTSGKGYCTAGLPAVRISTGRPVMVAAGHCFARGSRVFTGAGPTWQYGNGRVGSYVGTVTARNTTWDAALLEGANNNADESDTSTWKPLVGSSYSWVGDYVCHSGQRSARLGHATPCGIKVTDADLWFRVSGSWARGVEGVDSHGWGSVNGDSGATVWALTTRGRVARGMVSHGGLDGTGDQRRVDWVEAPDIFRAYGLRLNPVT